MVTNMLTRTTGLIPKETLEEDYFKLNGTSDRKPLYMRKIDYV